MVVILHKTCRVGTTVVLLVLSSNLSSVYPASPVMTARDGTLMIVSEL